MKKISIIIISIIFILIIVSFFTKKYINQNYLFINEGENEIINDIILECTSRYMISLKDKHNQYYVPSYIDKIGWNENYVVILQYDLILKNSYTGYTVPNKDKENYYIIDIRKKRIDGPMSKTDYQYANIKEIKLKKII